MESLPLKELDFGLQKSTGPSSGVVASIVLIIIALSFFFYTTHTPFRLYWKILVLRTTFLGLSKIRIVVVFNPNFVIKLYHWKALVLLYKTYTEFFFFPFYCRVIWIFVEKCLKIFLKISKKIMKSAMGIPCLYFDPLCPLYKVPLISS